MLKESKNKFSNAMKQYPWDYMGLILAAWVIPALYGLLNRYFIGFMSYESVVTEQSFEALEVLMEVFIEMFPLAILALVARKFTDTKSVFKVVRTGFLMQLIITSIFVIFFVIFAKYFIDWINTPENAKPLALEYFRIRILALPFQTIGLLLLISIKAMRKGWTAVILAFIGVLVNFTLDALFISNYSFSMKLGLVGSAWDNVFSNVLIFLIAGFVFLRLVKEKPEFKLSKAETTSILRIGRWTGLESLVRNIGYIVGMVAVVNAIGVLEPAAIGGYNTAMWVMWGITLIPIMGWTEATQIAIGNAYGRNDIKSMKDVQFVSTFLMGLYMVIWVGIGLIAWKPISIWLNQGIDVEVANYSVTTFHYLIFPYILFAIGSGLKAYFIGIGKPFLVLVASGFVNIIIYLPLGLLVKYGDLSIDYTTLMIITNAVFILDFIIMIIFTKKYSYKPITLDNYKAKLPI